MAVFFVAMAVSNLYDGAYQTKGDIYVNKQFNPA